MDTGLVAYINLYTWVYQELTKVIDSYLARIIYFYYLFFRPHPIQCLEERKHNIEWDGCGKIGNKNK